VKELHTYNARLIAAALFAAATSLLARPARAQQIVDRVVASVDGDPITMHDVRTFSAASGTPLPDDSDPRTPDLVRKALKGLIENKLLESETKSFESQVEESQIDKFIQRMEDENHMTEQQFREELLKNGVTWEEFRKRAQLEVEKALMLEKDVRSKITISDAEIKTYYNSHRSDYTNDTERYRLAQILIAVAKSAPPDEIAQDRKKAEKVRKRAASGEDFAALALQFSDDDSKSKGGELGYFAPDEIMDQIRTAVTGLQTGEVSQVIQTSHGFHILKVEEHQLPGPKPLADVQDDIRDKLTDAKAKENFLKFIDEDLVKNHHVESFY
jgi:parvulin-like peptidyl-prolyl isomerase